MCLLKLCIVWDSFIKDGTACHILDPKILAFSIPYPVVYGFGAEMFLPLRRLYGASFSMKRRFRFL